ncbi:MAG: hypothetical protein KTR21_08630 [Rhodobacteraceae bacterium]|nr:hypothetical protein [Paracoccaceae bacterium]
MSRILALNPVVYWLIGVPFILAGLLLFFHDHDIETTRAQALAGPPPTMVQLSSFNPNRNVGLSEEVFISAQLDIGATYKLTKRTTSLDSTRWMAPLYDIRARTPEKYVRAVMFESADEITRAQLETIAVDTSGARPLVEMNGVLANPSPEFRKLAAEALAEHGFILSPDAIFIDPFLDGREVGLGRQILLRNIAFALGGFGALALIFGMLRRIALMPPPPEEYGFYDYH